MTRMYSDRSATRRDIDASIADGHHGARVASHRRRTTGAGVAGFALSAALLALAPAGALARTLVRVVHAVPSVGRADVGAYVDGRLHTIATLGFGQATGWKSVAAGPLRWALSRGSRTLATGTVQLGNGSYDLVALQEGSKVKMGVFRARGGEAGKALVRVIHAAPQLGSPQLMVDGKVVVKKLAFTQATPYLAVAPGTHMLAAERPGTMKPFLSAKADLQAGRAYSVVVVGSAGQRVRVVPLVDRSAAVAVAARRTVHTAADAAVVVHSGDSLWSIAHRLVGAHASDSTVEARLVRIWDANKQRIGTGNPDLIYPGTRLTV